SRQRPADRLYGPFVRPRERSRRRLAPERRLRIVPGRLPARERSARSWLLPRGPSTGAVIRRSIHACLERSEPAAERPQSAPREPGRQPGARPTLFVAVVTPPAFTPPGSRYT